VAKDWEQGEESSHVDNIKPVVKLSLSMHGNKEVSSRNLL